MSLMLAPNQRRSDNPALMAVTGSISNGANWNEIVTITTFDGTQLTGVTGVTFALQLRQRKEDRSPILSLTTDSELVVTEGASASTLSIDADASVVGALDPGDYIIDIVGKIPSTGRNAHVAHGIVKVIGAPITI